MNGVNLIPAYRVEAARRRKHIHAWSVSCVAYGLLCLGVYALCAWQWSEGGGLAASLEAASTDIAVSSRAAVKLRGQLAEAQSRLQAEQSIATEPDWSVLLALLADLVGDDVVLNDCRLAPASEKSEFTSLTIRGFARTQTSVSTFALRLEGVNLFDQVKLIKSNRETYMNADAVSFEMECTLGKIRGGS
jgi:Tfp pilus assembly protein PilN